MPRRYLSECVLLAQKVGLNELVGASTRDCPWWSPNGWSTFRFYFERNTTHICVRVHLSFNTRGFSRGNCAARPSHIITRAVLITLNSTWEIISVNGINESFPPHFVHRLFAPRSSLCMRAACSGVYQKCQWARTFESNREWIRQMLCNAVNVLSFGAWGLWAYFCFYLFLPASSLYRYHFLALSAERYVPLLHSPKHRPNRQIPQRIWQFFAIPLSN